MEISEPVSIPATFARRIIDLHGQAGEDWLSDLPGLLRACAEQWALRIAQPFPELSYNYVAPATGSDGAAVVLKLGFPGPDLTREADALRLMDGRGSVRLLATDLDNGTLLLERAQPGHTLEALCEQNDEAATSLAASVMHCLWQPLPPGHAFPSVQDWAAELNQAQTEHERGSPLPVRLLDRATGLLHDLTCSVDEPVLLHGDLHHGNILSAEREPWLAIDPKGIVGEPAAEAGALIRNPIPQLLTWPNLSRVLERRVHQLAEELKLDRKRVHAWATAQAVLASVWAFEDHQRCWEPWIKVAEVLLSLRE